MKEAECKTTDLRQISHQGIGLKKNIQMVPTFNVLTTFKEG
jgi:hypothetical protein